MISPARFPNCPISTGAISPLSSNSADTISLGSEMDPRSCCSLALCLSATGTPKVPLRALLFINERSSLEFLAHDSQAITVPNYILNSLIREPLAAAAERCARNSCRFGRDHLRQHAPRLQLRGIRADIAEAVERAAAAIGLHGFEHVRVFQKGGFRALVKELGHVAVADRKVAGKAEQVVTRRLDLGRDQMA